MTDYLAIVPLPSGERWGVSFINAKLPWKNFRVVRLAADGSPFKPAPGQHFAEKRSLFVGWNGERFCRNRDVGWAEANDPELLDKLGRYLKQHHA